MGSWSLSGMSLAELSPSPGDLGYAIGLFHCPETERALTFPEVIEV